MKNNQYIVQPNEQGGYDLILGSEIDINTIENLIAELKMKAIIPVKAKVTTYINGITYMAKFKENAEIFTAEKLNPNSDTLLKPQSEPICKQEKPKIKIKKIKSYQ